MRVGRDATVKGNFAEVLFSVCILVFNLSIWTRKKLWPFFLFPFPPTLLCMNKLSFEKTTSLWSGSVLWSLRHLMTSINYSITIFIPLTRLQVKFDQQRAMPHLTPRKHNLTLTKKQLLLSVLLPQETTDIVLQQGIMVMVWGFILYFKAFPNPHRALYSIHRIESQLKTRTKLSGACPSAIRQHTK